MEITNPAQFKTEDLVEWYIRLRTYKSDLKKSIADKLDYTTEQMDAIEAELNTRLVKADAHSMRTVSGTISRVAKTKYQVADPYALRQWVIANPEVGVTLLAGNISQGEVTAYLEDNPDATLPDGVSCDNYYDISIRRAK